MPRLPENPAWTPVLWLSDRPTTDVLTGSWRSLGPVIDRDRCTRCMLCWKFCPEACVHITAERPEIDMRYCKGCGICAVECPPRCITMKVETEEVAP